jgi:hypothetical protein
MISDFGRRNSLFPCKKFSIRRNNSLFCCPVEGCLIATYEAKIEATRGTDPLFIRVAALVALVALEDMSIERACSLKKVDVLWPPNGKKPYESHAAAVLQPLAKIAGPGQYLFANRRGEGPIARQILVNLIKQAGAELRLPRVNARLFTQTHRFLYLQGISDINLLAAAGIRPANLTYGFHVNLTSNRLSAIGRRYAPILVGPATP